MKASAAILFLILGVGLTAAEAQSLVAPVGVGGGLVTAAGGTIEAQVSVGDFFSGGVIGNVTAAVEDKGGYTGQLYDPVAVTVAASPETVPESGTRQLVASAQMDDDTTLALAAGEVSWSVLSGPISGIDGDGLATADAVALDAAADVQGSWLGIDGTLTLIVLDLDPDNFGSYAGDGIDDDWQIGFFGLPPNVLAGPDEDPDGDEQDNLFEFLALVDPTDPLSFFCVELEPVPGQPLQRDITFFPTALGSRTYTVSAASDLSPTNFTALSGATTSDNGTVRTVTDTLALPQTRRFYRVDITND